MNRIRSIVTVTVLVAGAAVHAADDFTASTTYTVRCDGHAIALETGGAGGVTRHRDGRVTLDDARGGFAEASCALGCLATGEGGSCHVVAPAPRRPRPRPAPFLPAFDVNCPGGNTFEMVRANGQGDCTTEVDSAGNVTGGSCDDGNGNSAEVDCTANEGEGRCVSEQGSTTCDIVH